MTHGQEEIQRVYDRMGIKFDEVLGESFYHDQLATVVEELQARGLSRESEGRVVRFS